MIFPAILKDQKKPVFATVILLVSKLPAGREVKSPPLLNAEKKPTGAVP